MTTKSKNITKAQACFEKFQREELAVVEKKGLIFSKTIRRQY